MSTGDVPSAILFLRAHVQDNHSLVLQSGKEFGGVYGLQSVAVFQERLHYTFEFC